MKTGDIRDNWTIEELLGEGTFGQVYKISRVEMGNKYYSALKVINIPKNSGEYYALKNQGMTDAEIDRYFRDVAEDFTTELKVMNELKGHSNIVSYEDHHIEKNPDGIGWTICIRMELLTPLYKYAEENQLREKDIIKLGVDMCEALSACRKKNIIHRDIKPANIFVSRFGDFKLGDFGIARKLEKTQSGLSKKGTYAYMAPEVYLGKPYNHTVDICSLGLVLYSMLNNGRTPFLPEPPKPIRYSDNEMALMKRLNGEPVPMPANGSAELAAVVLRACAFDPRDRYRSPQEMEEALLAVLNGGATVKKSDSVPQDYNDQTEQATVDMSKTKTADQTAVKNDTPKKSNKKLIVALLCVILALLIALLAVVGIDFNKSGESDAPQPGVTEKITGSTAPEPTTAEPSTAEPATEEPTEPKGVDLTKEIDAASKQEKTFSILENGFAYIDKNGTARRFEFKSSSVKEVPYDIEDNKDFAAIEYTKDGNGVGFGIKKDGSVVILSKGKSKYKYENALPFLENIADVISYEPPSEAAAELFDYALVCGLRKNGTVVMVAINNKGVAKSLKYYEPWKDIKSISFKQISPIGLKSDRTLIKSGKNQKIEQYQNYTDIAAINQSHISEMFEVMLKRDGTLVSDVEEGSFWYKDGWDKAMKWTDVVGFDMSGSRIVVLKKDGTVLAAGDNTNGQCNASGWKNMAAVQTRGKYSVGKKTDGTFAIATSNSKLVKSFEEAVNNSKKREK